MEMNYMQIARETLKSVYEFLKRDRLKELTEEYTEVYSMSEARAILEKETITIHPTEFWEEYVNELGKHKEISAIKDFTFADIYAIGCMFEAFMDPESEKYLNENGVNPSEMIGIPKNFDCGTVNTVTSYKYDGMDMNGYFANIYSSCGIYPLLQIALRNTIYLFAEEFRNEVSFDKPYPELYEEAKDAIFPEVSPKVFLDYAFGISTYYSAAEVMCAMKHMKGIYTASRKSFVGALCAVVNSIIAPDTGENDLNIALPHEPEPIDIEPISAIWFAYQALQDFGLSLVPLLASGYLAVKLDQPFYLFDQVFEYTDDSDRYPIMHYIPKAELIRPLAAVFGWNVSMSGSSDTIHSIDSPIISKIYKPFLNKFGIEIGYIDGDNDNFELDMQVREGVLFLDRKGLRRKDITRNVKFILDTFLDNPAPLSVTELYWLHNYLATKYAEQYIKYPNDPNPSLDKESIEFIFRFVVNYFSDEVIEEAVKRNSGRVSPIVYKIEVARHMINLLPFPDYCRALEGFGTEECSDVIKGLSSTELKEIFLLLSIRQHGSKPEAISSREEGREWYLGRKISQSYSREFDDEGYIPELDIDKYEYLCANYNALLRLFELENRDPHTVFGNTMLPVSMKQVFTGSLTRVDKEAALKHQAFLYEMWRKTRP